jgi:hypothetical protein
MLQFWNGKSYEDLIAWTKCEAGGVKIKFNEDNAIAKSKQGNLRQMKLNPLAGSSLESATKRFALSVYFDAII